MVSRRRPNLYQLELTNYRVAVQEFRRQRIIPARMRTWNLTFFPRYPKHVWSPTGGWYAQPSNWKANTAVFSAIIFGLTALTWKLSAEREYRHKMPEPGRFFPSR